MAKPLKSFSYTQQLFSCYTVSALSAYKCTMEKMYWFDLLSDVFYQYILLLGEFILLGGFELGDEALDVSGVGANFSE